MKQSSIECSAAMKVFWITTFKIRTYRFDMLKRSVELDGEI